MLGSSATPAATTTATSATAAPRFPDKKCFKFERGQCKSKNCAFVHPTSCCAEFSRTGICRDRDCLEMHLGEHKDDCWFWRMGSCRFDESDCGRGLHRPEMLESIKGGRKEKEAGPRKEQVVSGGIPVSWASQAATTAPAAAASQASFFGGGRGNQVTELLRTMTTMMTPATEAVPTVTSPGISQEQLGLIFQLLAPMASGLQGGRPAGQ